jgi:hypothetical protein
MVCAMLQRFSPTAVGRWRTRRPVLAIAGWLSFVVQLISFAALVPVALAATALIAPDLKGTR